MERPPTALARFARAGGEPPASHEVLAVHPDGTAVLRAGTAWPGGAADAAGVYELRLDAARLSELERLVRGAGEGAPSSAPTGGERRCILRLTDGDEERRVVWPAGAEPPEPVAALARTLDDLRIAAREHPFAAVQLRLVAGKGPVEAGEPADLALAFSAIGPRPLTLTVIDAGVRLASGGDPPPLAWIHDASALSGATGGPVEIAPGNGWTLAVRTPTAPAEPGPHRLDGFARVALDLADGEHLNAVLAAGPLAVEVW